MATVNELLNTFAEVSANPRNELNKHLAAGKRVIGVGPYYVPEELVYAAGAVPFGVWGCIGTTDKAKKYFPPFYCSICQMSLEMGLNKTLEGLSGMMVTTLCDTLKAYGQNWKAGVEGIPAIFVSQPQHRQIEAGFEFARDSYQDVLKKVEECCGAVIEDEGLSAAIKLFNEWRSEMATFVKLAGTHPAEVSNAARVAVINAGYYMDKAEHLALVKELNAQLAALPESQEGYKKIVLSGIYEDIPAITDILDQNKYAVVADDLAKESRAFAVRVSEQGDPLDALAQAWCDIEGDPILFDPEKIHLSNVVKVAQENNADGVVVLLAKFCDPEEFEAPLTRNACKAAGIPSITIEIDQQTESYEQARTQLDTFAELL